MKILLVSPTEKGIGGVAQHVQGLSKFLTNQNHKIDIISSEPLSVENKPDYHHNDFAKRCNR